MTKSARALLMAGFAATLAGAGAARASSSGAPPITDRDLVGAWRLVKTEMKTFDGRTFPDPTYGEDPSGYLIYDPSHTMCVFLDVGNPAPETPKQYLRKRRKEPATYCGKWYIEPSGQAVIHEVELALLGQITGKQRRLAVLDHDTLYIRSVIPEGLADRFLQFERVKDQFGNGPGGNGAARR